ncbi:hypothetical protein QR680_017377 [Steinernema hermaphroditum]|uniref:Uncharacterized protein n=1 Tax=Steinernema hermaphroditum TaxID=289476 RepID=A0AA39HGH5_9BILA|nr:hypothetical protein QR680_017377 [Steinernema hermaphroditum]
MAEERSWSPVAGYAGHVPGRRWNVGGSRTKKARSPVPSIVMKRLEITHEGAEKAPKTATSGHGDVSPVSEDFNASFISEATQTDMAEAKKAPPKAAGLRSTSVPWRKVKPGAVDVFSGLEGGWWSQSETVKNLSRHKEGLEMKAGRGTVSPSTRRADFTKTEEDVERVPCAGYSGHLPGFRHYDVGKSFGAAARKSRRDRLEQRFRS